MSLETDPDELRRLGAPSPCDRAAGGERADGVGAPRGGLDFAPERWGDLVRGLGVERDEPVIVALSGGADSVYLLHLVARAWPRPRIVAVHVDHGWRGDAARADAQFCAERCAEAGVPFRLVTLNLDPSGPSPEARAREARYAALIDAARRNDARVIATGHHADDALETLLVRWIRGTPIEGLAGLQPRLEVSDGPHASARERTRAFERAGHAARTPDVIVVRPLLALRREEVRRALVAHGLAWREDATNTDARFARNRVRHVLLPRLAELGGEGAIENLRAFGRAVEELEERCAERTLAFAWSPPAHAAVRRGADDVHLGGTIARAGLAALSRALLRRVLWRLLTEGTGASPARATLTRIVEDVACGRTGSFGLPRGWHLRLRSDALHLEPPVPRAKAATRTSGQLEMYAATELEGRELCVPGHVSLHDGRTLHASVRDLAGDATLEFGALEVELDLDLLARPFVVRFPRPGDRFHGLGAPGTKALSRFLADAGVPREGRGRVPLFVAGGAIAWVAGLRPSHAARVTSATRRRLHLRLEHPTAERRQPERAGPTAHLPFAP